MSWHCSRCCREQVGNNKNERPLCDLCREIETLRSQRAALREALEKIASLADDCTGCECTEENFRSFDRALDKILSIAETVHDATKEPVCK